MKAVFPSRKLLIRYFQEYGRRWKVERGISIFCWTPPSRMFSKGNHEDSATLYISVEFTLGGATELSVESTLAAHLCIQRQPAIRMTYKLKRKRSMAAGCLAYREFTPSDTCKFFLKSTLHLKWWKGQLICVVQKHFRYLRHRITIVRFHANDLAFLGSNMLHLSIL